MGSHFNRVRVLSLRATDWEKVFSQHERIASSIFEKKIGEARDAMNEHLTKVNYDLGRLRQEYPSYFKTEKGR